jgi:hypothetical protein
MIAAHLRKRRLKPHTTWHLGDVYFKIDGRIVYLWHPVQEPAGPSIAWTSCSGGLHHQSMTSYRVPDGRPAFSDHDGVFGSQGSVN